MKPHQIFIVSKQYILTIQMDVHCHLFGIKFFGMNELIVQSSITPGDYKTLYQLFTFGVSKRKEKLKSSVIDIQIKANFPENVPANT